MKKSSEKILISFFDSFYPLNSADKIKPSWNFQFPEMLEIG